MYEPITHKTVSSALSEFLMSGRQIKRLAPSHVNNTGKQVVSARTRENLFDRSLKEHVPDNLLDLMI